MTIDRQLHLPHFCLEHYIFSQIHSALWSQLLLLCSFFRSTRARYTFHTANDQRSVVGAQLTIHNMRNSNSLILRSIILNRHIRFPTRRRAGELVTSPICCADQLQRRTRSGARTFSKFEFRNILLTYIRAEGNQIHLHSPQFAVFKLTNQRSFSIRTPIASTSQRTLWAGTRNASNMILSQLDANQQQLRSTDYNQIRNKFWLA